MYWKDIKLRGKLISGFALVLVLLVIVAIISYRGVDSIKQDAQAVILSNQIDSLLAQKKIDYLNWINRVNQLWTDPEVHWIDVQTDDHKCGLGEWLYGPGRQQLETVYPGLAGLLKKLEKPIRNCINL